MNVPPDKLLKLQGAFLVGHVERRRALSARIDQVGGGSLLVSSLQFHVILSRHWHNRDTPASSSVLAGTLRGAVAWASLFGLYERDVGFASDVARDNRSGIAGAW